MSKDEAVFYAALVAAGSSLLLTIFNSVLALRYDRERVQADYNAVKVVRNLMKHEKLPYRSFAMLRHYIGGYSDDELRKLLVRAGAVRAMSSDGREVWGLWSRIVRSRGQKSALPSKLSGALQAPADKDLFPAKLPNSLGR